MRNLLQTWIQNSGLSEPYASYVSEAALALVILILAFVVNLIVKRRLLKAVQYVVTKSRMEWDDILYKRKVFHRLSHFAPAFVIFLGAGLFPEAQVWIQRFAVSYMTLIGLLVLDALLTSTIDIYRTFEVSKERPIKGYVQIAKIFIYVVGGVSVLTTLMGKSPWGVLSGIGAATAVLLFVFKDTILGLVAGMQLAWNDMLRPGDWIAMPKYGADGTVIDISLHTVKVQNWNKTIASVPTYALISDSFTNWRGMEESGGRRIKRALSVDMTSVRFCSDKMLDRFESIALISDYVRAKREEVANYNKEHGFDPEQLLNGRRLTNLGTFRAYVVAYLRQHPKVRQDMTFLVRHLAPTEHGLPIEIYVFSADQAWTNYEAIQADIFDHLIAAVQQFDLKVFQYPAGTDLRAALMTKSASTPVPTHSQPVD